MEEEGKKYKAIITDLPCNHGKSMSASALRKMVKRYCPFDHVNSEEDSWAEAEILEEISDMAREMSLKSLFCGWKLEYRNKPWMQRYGKGISFVYSCEANCMHSDWNVLSGTYVELDIDGTKCTVVGAARSGGIERERELYGYVLFENDDDHAIAFLKQPKEATPVKAYFDTESSAPMGICVKRMIGNVHCKNGAKLLSRLFTQLCPVLAELGFGDY